MNKLPRGPQGGGSKRRPEKKNMGQEIVEALEGQAAMMRAEFRPLTEEEKARVRRVVDLIPSCLPDDEDAYLLKRLQEATEFVGDLDDDMDPDLLVFVLGMAYERMRAQTLRP